MTLDEELKQLRQNTKKDIGQLYEKIKQYPLFSLFFILVALSLIVIPYLQVNYQGISNNTERATLENQYRATFAQILGGVAIGIGLYYTWRRIAIAEKDLKATQENLKVTQENLKVSQEGQITERFTRAIEQLGAIDQFGNPAIEIRLGGIYSLERIANESEKDYWPIMEILTAYVRKNSSINSRSKENFLAHETISMDIQADENEKTRVTEIRKVSLDIHAILTVIGRGKSPLNNEETNYIDLHETNLQKAPFYKANLSEANLSEADLSEAILSETNLSRAKLEDVNLKRAFLIDATLEGTFLMGANLEEAILTGANLKWSLLTCANFKRAWLSHVNLEEAFLLDVNLEGADIQNAILKQTFLMNANLSKTNLSGANLFNTYLQGADLRGAHGLSLDQLSKAKTLYDAKLDEKLLVSLKEKYPALFEKPEEGET